MDTEHKLKWVPWFGHYVTECNSNYKTARHLNGYVRWTHKVTCQKCLKKKKNAHA